MFNFILGLFELTPDGIQGFEGNDIIEVSEFF